MTTPVSPSSDHDEFQSLLPWFANGSLDAKERAVVQAHLDACAECRSHLEVERRIGVTVRASALPARSPEPGLARLMSTIAAREPGRRQAPRRGLAAWLARWKAWTAPDAWPMALAGAGALAVIIAAVALQTLPTGTVEATSPDAYHVLGLPPASRATGASDLHLVMAPSVDAARRAALLAIVDGRIIDGPNSVGAYTVRIAASGGPVDLTGALDRLRREPDVVLAEAATPLAMPHIGPDLAP